MKDGKIIQQYGVVRTADATLSVAIHASSEDSVSLHACSGGFFAVLPLTKQGAQKLAAALTTAAEELTE